MNRRGFLAGAAVAVSAVPIMTSAAVGKPDGIRMSNEEQDEGYRAYCLARGDGKEVKVYLNGDYQKGAVTADERTGMVKRVVYTDSGNIAHDGVNILYEEVYGDVRIILS